MTHPIDRVEWVRADSLSANHWNPNVVYDQELRLLERSILAQGWVFPIVISASGVVVDGFHRWRLAQDSKEIRARDGGMVPVVRLPIGEDEARAMTVRMNRARGEHVASRMSEIVRSLVNESGWEVERVAASLGATTEEVALLLDASLFKKRNLSSYRYSEAWEPNREDVRRDDARKKRERRRRP